MKKYRVDVYEDVRGFHLLSRKYIMAANEEEAKEKAEPSTIYVEVMKVK